MEQSRIRNFCIIAHIDHGKSTLADRLLELTGTISQRDMPEQVLDTMDLEREKGITIKAKAVRMLYTADDGRDYELNLIDTPGHVDFTYEVSRALAACEGALLVVDAAQGIQAQTLATRLPGPRAQPDASSPSSTRSTCRAPSRSASRGSSSTVIGFDARRDAVRLREGGHRRPRRPGGGRASASRRRTAASTRPLRALIFDSKYDAYKGVIAYVRVVDGSLRAGAASCG